MLLKIRDKSKGFFAYLIVGLIVIAFSMWGVDSLFSAMYGDPNEAAKVNGTSLSQFDVDRLAQRQMQQLLQNEQLDPEQINLDFLRQFALSALIQEELLKQLASDNKMTIAERQLERQLVRMQVFQDAEGRFVQENFTQVLRQQGLSPQAFRNQLKQDLLNQQILGGLAASEFTLPQEVDEFQRLVGQKRSYSYKLFAAEDFLAGTEPSQEQLEDYYQANSFLYQRPEQVKVDYVLFNPDTLLDQLEPSASELEAEYLAYTQQLKNQAASYSAAHILLEFSNAEEKQAAKEKLEQIKQEVEAGASFAAKAQEFSADFATAATGGELGQILAGSFNPEFEQALFSLEEVNQLSEPIETSYGLHLIQLTDKQAAIIPSLEEVKAELTQKLVAQPWREAVEAKLEELTNLSFSAGDLQELAEQTGLQLTTSDWLVRNQLNDFWQEAAVAQAVFNKDLLEDGWLTEPLALSNGQYLIAQKNTYQQQKQLELADVTEEVSQAVKLELAAQLAEEAAKEELAAAEADEQRVATWEKVELAQRGGNFSINNFNPAVNAQAFKLHLNQSLQQVKISPTHLAVIKLDELVDGELDDDPEHLSQLNEGLAASTANRLQEHFIQQLQNQAKIVLR